MLRGERLGEGAFGIVYAGRSPTEGHEYAIKRNITEKDTSFIGVLRELDLLNRFRFHPHIVSLEIAIFKNPFPKNILSPLRGEERTGQRDDTLHFAFPKAQEDLTAYLQRKGTPNYAVLKGYMVDILLGVEHIHRSGVIHRDIKPCNILLFAEKGSLDPPPAFQPRKKKILKYTTDPACATWTAHISDFGLAKPYTKQGLQTDGTVTSWYRAPEIVMAHPHYDYKADVWAVGCTFYEMAMNKFFIHTKSASDEDLLRAIISALPEPLERAMRLYVNNNKQVPMKIRPQEKKRPSMLEQIALSAPLAELFAKEAGDLASFADLLSRMLTFNWEKRITVSEALDHPFFTSHRERICLTRSVQPLNICEEVALCPLPCIERTWMADLAMLIFRNGGNGRYRQWYQHRVLFQAISLFDRYLRQQEVHMDQNVVESAYLGRLHSKHDAELRFLVCLYLCFKYFSSIYLPVSYETVVGKRFSSPADLAAAEAFEMTIVRDYFNCDIYRPTIYEAADNYDDYLSDVDIYELLVIYVANTDFAGLTPQQVYAHYRTHLRGKGEATLMAFARHLQESKTTGI